MAWKGPRPAQGLRAVRMVGAALSMMAWSGLLAGPAAAADDESPLPEVPQSLNGALEQLDIKAKPAGPAPAFVTRTRPGPARLHYMPEAVPHAVSPVPVKTPAQIQAAKDALDAAQVRQLNPVPPPVDLTAHAASPKPAPSKPAPSRPAGARVVKVKPAGDAD